MLFKAHKILEELDLIGHIVHGVVSPFLEFSETSTQSSGLYFHIWLFVLPLPVAFTPTSRVYTLPSGGLYTPASGSLLWHQMVYYENISEVN